MCSRDCNSSSPSSGADSRVDSLGRTRDSSLSSLFLISRISNNEEALGFTKGSVAKTHVIARALQLEQGCTRSHLSFFVRHDWQDNGPGRVIITDFVEEDRSMSRYVTRGYGVPTSHFCQRPRTSGIGGGVGTQMVTKNKVAPSTNS
jgi:hypothetical protein